MAQLKYQVYRVIAHLQDREAYTSNDLAYELKIDKRTAQRHLKELWALDLVHICGWDREYQQPIAVYRWGNRPDVEKPSPITRAESAKRYRERRAENGKA